MIKSFRHKGLRRFWLVGGTAGLGAEQAMLLGDRLDMLIAAKAVEDMDKPGWRLHPVQDTQKQRWAVSVGDNWHLTFEFENGNAYHVDYEDYH